MTLTSKIVSISWTLLFVGITKLLLNGRFVILAFRKNACYGKINDIRKNSLVTFWLEERNGVNILRRYPTLWKHICVQVHVFHWNKTCLKIKCPLQWPDIIQCLSLCHLSFIIANLNRYNILPSSVCWCYMYFTLSLYNRIILQVFNL